MFPNEKEPSFLEIWDFLLWSMNLPSNPLWNYISGRAVTSTAVSIRREHPKRSEN